MHHASPTLCVALSVSMFLLLSNSAFADETEQLRKELADLNSQAAELTRKIASLETKLSNLSDAKRATADGKSSDRRYGLDGYCPVTLKQREIWKMGRIEYRVVHQECVYLFVGPQEKATFEAQPEKYAPLLSGRDPVLWIDKKQHVSGNRRHGIFIDDRVVLFSTEDNLHHFLDNRSRYPMASILNASNMKLDGETETTDKSEPETSEATANRRRDASPLSFLAPSSTNMVGARRAKCNWPFGAAAGGAVLRRIELITKRAHSYDRLQASVACRDHCCKTCLNAFDGVFDNGHRRRRRIV